MVQGEYAMGEITLQGLRTFARSLHGMELQTKARGMRFRFYVEDHGFTYVPMTTQEPRTQNNKNIEAVLERYKQGKKSLRPGDYADISVCASYLLVVIERYVNR